MDGKKKLHIANKNEKKKKCMGIFTKHPNKMKKTKMKLCKIEVQAIF